MERPLVLVLIATLALALSACGTADVPTLPTEEGTGTAFFSVTDEAPDMGAIESVVITFSELSVQSPSQGWMTIELEEQTFDLLELEAQNALALLAEVDLEPGVYNQMRLDVSSVIITDDEGDHEAFLPSGVLRLAGQLVVVEGETSSATFDFLVNESLHVTGDGQYIMTPVIQLETRERAQVRLEANNRVRVEGGQVSENAKLGMDIDGEMRQGRPVDAGANVSIVDGRVQVQTPQGVRVGVDVESGVGSVEARRGGNAQNGMDDSEDADEPMN